MATCSIDSWKFNDAPDSDDYLIGSEEQQQQPLAEHDRPCPILENDNWADNGVPERSNLQSASPTQLVGQVAKRWSAKKGKASAVAALDDEKEKTSAVVASDAALVEAPVEEEPQPQPQLQQQQQPQPQVHVDLTAVRYQKGLTPRKVPADVIATTASVKVAVPSGALIDEVAAAQRVCGVPVFAGCGQVEGGVKNVTLTIAASDKDAAERVLTQLVFRDGYVFVPTAAIVLASPKPQAYRIGKPAAAPQAEEVRALEGEQSASSAATTTPTDESMAIADASTASQSTSEHDTAVQPRPERRRRTRPPRADDSPSSLHRKATEAIWYEPLYRDEHAQAAVRAMTPAEVRRSVGRTPSAMALNSVAVPMPDGRRMFAWELRAFEHVVDAASVENGPVVELPCGPTTWLVLGQVPFEAKPDEVAGVLAALTGCNTLWVGHTKMREARGMRKPTGTMFVECPVGVDDAILALDGRVLWHPRFVSLFSTKPGGDTVPAWELREWLAARDEYKASALGVRNKLTQPMTVSVSEKPQPKPS